MLIRFNKNFARIEPEKFIKNTLVKQLKVKAVFVGEDFMFGRNRSGNVTLFKELGKQYSYEAHGIAALKQGKAVISSSRIRALLQEDQLGKASALLGRPVFTSGKVVKGAQRGRTLGYPTANVDYESDIIPSKGVYVVQAKVGKKIYKGMANIGIRPSFKGDTVMCPLLEVHLLDFSGNLYGKHLEVGFLKKIRNEKKFSAPPQLIAQIQKDESQTRRFFAHLK